MGSKILGDRKKWFRETANSSYAYKILVIKSEEKRLLRGTGYKWEDNIELDL
jgi:hypothetical protein